MRYLIPALQDFGAMLKGRRVAPVELYDPRRKARQLASNWTYAWQNPTQQNRELNKICHNLFRSALVLLKPLGVVCDRPSAIPRGIAGDNGNPVRRGFEAGLSWRRYPRQLRRRVGAKLRPVALNR
jgi:hypothetical protein